MSYPFGFYVKRLNSQPPGATEAWWHLHVARAVLRKVLPEFRNEWSLINNDGLLLIDERLVKPIKCGR